MFIATEHQDEIGHDNAGEHDDCCGDGDPSEKQRDDDGGDGQPDGPLEQKGLARDLNRAHQENAHPYHRREVERVGPDDDAHARIVRSLDQGHQGGRHLRPVRRDRRQEPDRYLRQPVLRTESVKAPRESRSGHERDNEGDNEQWHGDHYSHAPTPERMMEGRPITLRAWGRRGRASNPRRRRQMGNRMKRAGLCPDRTRAVRVDARRQAAGREPHAARARHMRAEHGTLDRKGTGTLSGRESDCRPVFPAHHRGAYASMP